MYFTSESKYLFSDYLLSPENKDISSLNMSTIATPDLKNTIPTAGRYGPFLLKEGIDHSY